MEYKGRGSYGRGSNRTNRVVRARMEEWKRQEKDGEGRLRDVEGLWSAEGAISGV